MRAVFVCLVFLASSISVPNGFDVTKIWPSTGNAPRATTTPRRRIWRARSTGEWRSQSSPSTTPEWGKSLRSTSPYSLSSTSSLSTSSPSTPPARSTSSRTAGRLPRLSSKSSEHPPPPPPISPNSTAEEWPSAPPRKKATKPCSTPSWGASLTFRTRSRSCGSRKCCVFRLRKPPLPHPASIILLFWWLRRVAPCSPICLCRFQTRRKAYENIADGGLTIFYPVDQVVKAFAAKHKNFAAAVN